MNYKERMKEEYQQLKNRYYKLHTMIVKYEVGKLDFEPTCSIELLKKQRHIMKEYMLILEERAKLENVELN